MTSHDTPPDADTGAVRENLTRDEARERAARVADVHTSVHLDLTTGAETFEATSRIRFRTIDDGGTFVDCTADRVQRVELDGEVLPAEVVEPTRIQLPGLHAGEHELTVVATMAYRHEGKGLHRFVDPSDDRVYLHSQFEPFDAHLVYACFDQPDLKTTFALSVDAPEEWVVVSNGRALERPDEGRAGRWVFEPTPVLSTYVTAIVAGSYAEVTDEHRGMPLGVFVRRSLAQYLDTDEIFEVTKQGLDYFEDVFATPYPFGKYDQLFVPEFSAGAMENPGAITFSELYVFRSKVTDANHERRAETILHEMAHMWFGDLVTMRWWDDLWLNESFATFMAVLSQADATRWRNAWVTFLDAEKAWAKMQDQLPSTHPVADEMPDVESVHQNFDGITYAKGASVLRQLVAWVGQDEFLAGVRDYFDRHAWGNTDLGDFLGALERTSGRDLAAWRDEWLLTTGVNTLTPEIELADDGTYADVVIVQSAPAPSWAGLPGVPAREPVLRRHRVAVGVYRRTAEGLVRDQRVELDVEGERTPVKDLVGVPAGDVLLVNDDDLTYAKVELDPASTRVLTDALDALVQPLPRALVWSSTWDMVRDGRLPARDYVDLVIRNVASESEVGVLQRLLLRATGAAERYADPAVRDQLLGRLARHARELLADLTPGSDHQLAVARHWAATARADEAQLADVQRLLDGALRFEGLELDTDLRWHLVICLARAGAVGQERIAAELERDDTDLGRRQAATARAVQPLADAKEAAWRQLLDDTSLSHTVSRQIWGGFSQLDQGEVLAPYTERYFASLDGVWRDRSLDWALEFSEGMFPHWAASPVLVDTVDATLAREDLPRPLRRILLEQRDTLVRTLDARARDAAA
ncbi:aminopeptidase N [Egicoccus sp. AB-alg2]|uniref:aminopeptidase N n=1 Tax=Egicoccus sp. AB-alg2 TaxID=3242693 RepID=UPI00359DEC57